MLPVRVKVLSSSSSCTLSEASSFLQRFLSGDACCDSLARDYVANVAQALQDCISRESAESEVSRSKHRHFVAAGSPSSSSSSQLLLSSSKMLVHGKQNSKAKEQPVPSLAETKLHGTYNHGKRSFIAVDDDRKSAGSPIADADSTHRRHKKKRKHSAVENGIQLHSASGKETDDDVLLQQKKRRKEEKTEGATENVATEHLARDIQKRRKKEKNGKETKHNIVTPDYENGRKKEKNERGTEEHIHAEDINTDIKKRHEKKERKDKQEAELNAIKLASPATDDKTRQKKKDAAKEKQKKDVDNAETLHVDEFDSSPAHAPVDESFNISSSVNGKKKKKRSVGHMDANKILDSGTLPTELASAVSEEKMRRPKKRKRKEDLSLSD